MSKLGKDRALERAFQEGLFGAGDSVKQRLDAAYKDGTCSDAEWASILAAHAKVDAIREQLIAIGYTTDDLLSLSRQGL